MSSLGKERLWKREDLLLGLVAAFASFAMYAWSAAPNVTLLDSGEFIIAAQHFGVPHPTGYPLWTILAWIFQLLPLGNTAWEINLFSGICGSLTVGVCAGLLHNLLSWCLEGIAVPRLSAISRIVALSFAMMLAFSQSFWSQAVIAEVYTLHALLVALFFVWCYSWVRQPSRDGLIYAAFFTLALAFSNHHLSMALAPLPYLLILLLRRRMFLDWLMAGVLTVVLVYLGFAILSSDEVVLRTAIRFFYCTLCAFAAFLWIRRLRIRWRFIAFLPLAVAAGLLPYAYLPLASSTNPPMNWGYAREPEGFYFSINRSQYRESLSEISVRSLGRLLGTAPARNASAAAPKKQTGSTRVLPLWIGFFWQKLVISFSPVALLGYFASVFLVLRLPLPKRTWLYFLHIAFVLAAFLQPLAAGAKIDQAEWWTQMPYHTYTNFIFAVLAGLGTGLLCAWFVRRRPRAFWFTPALLVLPIFTFLGSEDTCSQRDRWFGWMFGYDILKDLPPGSVMIGGTDPGRFVPTYMIFGESFQPPGLRRDPAFDRRDLYIITQNALGEKNYTKYLRDHYTKERPAPKNGFERWLGREKMYPETPLDLPNEQETRELARKAVVEAPLGSSELEKGAGIFGQILREIWERNQDAHEFFVEESFPIPWTYDYAIPHGLVYRLNKTKVDSLPPEAVREDFAYWSRYKARLLSNPAYARDLDAQRTFSKLRQAIANIYRHHGMNAEAERAYRESLELWKGNGEAIIALSAILWARGDFDEILGFWAAALEDDPANDDLWRMRIVAEKRKELEADIRHLERQLAAQPENRSALTNLIELYGRVGEPERARPLAEKALAAGKDDPQMLKYLIAHYEQSDELERTLEPALRLTQIESSNVANYLLLARAYFVQERRTEFYEAAERAIELGGAPVRENFIGNPAFSTWTNDARFKALTAPTPPGMK